jgi:hypothetical protein
MTGLALLAIPVVASAHGGNDDPSVVHACIGNFSKIVRIVGVSGSCISAPAPVAETPAHWGIQGPRGGAGANGTNGIDGTSVMFVDYFLGNQHGCPNGGAIFAAGSVNAYVCNGTNGTSGTRAAGPCFDNTNRYVDCGNGTVTDTVTGLIWLKQANCYGRRNWANANAVAATLEDGQCGLTDDSSPGDWRLPTKDEWIATMARANALGCTNAGPGPPPVLTNDAGTDCQSVGPSSFTGVEAFNQWSSTTSEESPDSAWVGNLFNGFTPPFFKVSALNFWPVRGGPR